MRSYSNRQKNFVKRIPVYLGILLLLAIYNPWKTNEPTGIDLPAYTETEVLNTRSAPKVGRYFIYVSPAGGRYFGKVQRIEQGIVELRLPDGVVWCKLDEGSWIDPRRLPGR